VLEPEKPVLARARAEIAAGRLWKARDRLTGALRGDPYDQALLDLLGSLYLQMGEQPLAGSHWFLTERSGKDVELARAAFEERFGGDTIELLRVLPLGREIERYPQPARDRLAPLLERASERGFELRGERIARLEQKTPSLLPSSGWKRLSLALVAIFLLLITVGVWIYGWIALLRS
jgi:hypothetical protein